MANENGFEAALDNFVACWRSMRRIGEVRDERTGHAIHTLSEYQDKEGKTHRQCDICALRADDECEDAWRLIELLIQDANMGSDVPSLDWVALLPGALPFVPANSTAALYLNLAGVWQARTPGEMRFDFQERYKHFK